MEQIKKYTCKFNNPYIFHNYTKKDIRFTKRIKKKYYLCKKLEECKILKKISSWKIVGWLVNKSLKRFKKKINYDFLKLEYSKEYAKKEFLKNKQNNNNIKLERYYVYDILPKEYIDIYKEGILKFQESCKQEQMFNDRLFLNEHIEKLKNKIHSSAYYNLGCYKIPSNMHMSTWFNSVNIVLSEFSSFYSITYELYINEKANQELADIFNSLVITEPIFSKNKKTITAYSSRASSDKGVAINDLILEMKYQFIKGMSKYIPTFFHKINKISPSLEVYSVDNFDRLHKTVGYFNIFGNDYDYSEKDGLACNISYFMGEDKRESRYSMIVDKSKDKKLKFMDDIFYSYPTQLTELLIAKSLGNEIEAKILKYQRELNSKLQKKLSAQNLLKFKIKTLKDMFIYKRYIDAVNNHEFIRLNEGYLKIFNNKQLIDFTKGKEQNAAGIWLKIEQSKYNFYKEQINDLFDFFDDNLRIVESSSNMSLVKWTLKITIIGVIISLVTLILTNKEISNAVLDLLKKLIKKL